MAQIQVKLTRSIGTSLTAEVRDHNVVVDRPEAKGGGNCGPMGGELLLAALGGCFMSTLIAAANAREVAIPDASCSVTGELAESPSRFVEIVVQVRCPGCDPGALEHLVAIAEQGCIVANTLKSATTLKVAAE